MQYFNPPRRNPFNPALGLRQLIVNSSQSCQHRKNSGCRFLPYKLSELYILKLQFFGESFFFNSN